MAIRTSGNPMNVAPEVEKLVQAIDSDQPVYRVATMQELMADSVAERRLAMILLAIFAGLAVLLAAVGTYGVLAYSVSRRTQEIGLRMALGARREDVLRMIGKEGLVLTGAGVAIGVVAALGLTRLMTSMLFDVRPADPMTFVAVSLLLAVVALVSSYLPARRAAKVEPMKALRYE
ncbi:MAG: hypothetical protein DMG21_05895 [Acidobacteria bacterium]|nr:MAG: hypothetical protein DMG21_05895 [Acidobacteriota bacterium]